MSDTCYDNGQSCVWVDDGWGYDTCLYCGNSRESEALEDDEEVSP